MIAGSIDTPMPIVTPRLLIRPTQPGDGAAVYEAQQESWPELEKWSIWTWKPQADWTTEDSEAFCVDRQKKFISHETMTLLSFDRQTGGLIGGASLQKPDWENRIFTIGFWVRTGETGKGYATEVATALARYAFSALAATKLISHHEAGNDGSGAVLRKVGFQHQYVRPKFHTRSDGTFADDHFYELAGLKDAPALAVSWGLQNVG